MNTIDPKQAAIFIAVFSVIALLINTTQGFGNASPATSVSVSVPTPAQQAAQATAAEHAQYLARYLTGGFTPKSGSRTVAVVATTEDGKLSRAITAAIASRFQNDADVLSSFFKPEFVSDGLFNDAFTGSTELFRKLDLANSVDVVLLARQDVQYSQSATLDNVITATMRLDVVAVPVSGQSDSMTWTFTAFGPGFTKEVARGAAEERLIKQIVADTKMSLN